MKKLLALLFLFAFCLNLTACAAFKSFNNPEVRAFRRELLKNYNCVDELHIKIGYGDSLVVECRIKEGTEYELANEIYQHITNFICAENITNAYFDAIDEIWGRIKLSISVGTDPRKKSFDYTYDIYKKIEIDEETAEFYSGFEKWPEEYSSLPEF